jgi:hypothetical protein
MACRFDRRRAAFVGHVAGMLAWCFSFYFYQDCFPEGYWLFGWKIANNVQSLVAINGLIGNLIRVSVQVYIYTVY